MQRVAYDDTMYFYHSNNQMWEKWDYDGELNEKIVCGEVREDIPSTASRRTPFLCLILQCSFLRTDNKIDRFRAFARSVFDQAILAMASNGLNCKNALV